MTDKKQQLFFELIQIALGQRECLTQVPSNKDWYALYELASKQALAGIAFHGVDVLGIKGGYLPQELLLQWIGLCEVVVKQRNIKLDNCCAELQQLFAKEGLNATILKGQGVAKLYDKDLSCLRQPGDIDVYVDNGLDNAIIFTSKLGLNDRHWDYKHLHLNIWNDVEVELHYRVEILFNLVKNKLLQKWFKKQNSQLYGSKFLVNDYTVVIPTVEFNVFYILLHIYRHFFTEGVGLRQLMDYYFVLRKVHYDDLMIQTYKDNVSQFGMDRFAKGVMWVMKEVFAMPEEWMPWEMDEKEGHFILAQIMEGGNFGHFAEKTNRLKGSLQYVENLCRHSLHLLCRYPSEAIWTPIWVVWHKCWKYFKKRQLA